MQPSSTIFFLCDIQPKLKPIIHAYDHVVSTANKMIKLAKLLGIEVVCTTQNAKGLGPIDPDVDLSILGKLHLGTFDKTLFSMLIPEVAAVLSHRPNCNSIVLFGIESHVCILQTVLSFVAQNTHKIYVIADGVSSSNTFEIPIALERMRTEGAIISTSESVAFQLMRDSAASSFRSFSQFIKDEKDRTRAAGEALLQVQGKEVVKSAM